MVLIFNTKIIYKLIENKGVQVTFFMIYYKYRDKQNKEIKMKIKNSTKLGKQILNLVKILDITNCVELDVNMNEELVGTGCGGRMRPTGLNKYEVQLNPEYSKNKLIKILAHEMIHVSQHDRGDLKEVKEETAMGLKITRFWKNKEIPASTPYRSLPWEIEAFDRMNTIGQKCR